MRLLTRAVLLSAALAACRGSSRESPDASARTSLSAAPDANADLAEHVDAYVSAFGSVWGDAHAAHGIVAIARGKEVVFAKTYGMRGGLDTRFAIGSVTKPLTAACLFRLIDSGKANLNDPLAKHVPEYAVAGGEHLTLKHLVTHSSGIPSYTDDSDLMRTRDARHEPTAIVARIAKRPLLFAPGARFSYSNSNYFLLGIVIERLTGQPYEAALRALVLEPAGMTRTTLSAPRDEDEAVGRTADADDRLVPARVVDPSFSFAASGARSTARDLFAFHRALEGTLLSQASRIEMGTPHAGQYGCGWECWREAGFEITSHEGGIDGYSAFFARAPEADLAVAVLLAADAFSGDRIEAGAIGEPVLAMALSGHAEKPPVETRAGDLDRARAELLAGSWALARSTPGPNEPKRAREVPSPARITIALDGERLFMSPSGEPRVRLFPAPDGSFFPKQIGVRLELGKDEVTLVRFGRKMVYRRPPP